MTATLPPEIQRVFDKFVTTEFTTIDRRGRPITWPVTPYYRPGDPCIDVTTGLGYPKKAKDALANPKVALLFSDPTGSDLERPPQVLVQGTADVDDRDLDANRERYSRESVEKLPDVKKLLPPDGVRGLFNWYFTRIYVHVRPERVYVWEDGDSAKEP
ncbi:MAG TPA: pyridoxamine 5'-phosphate oxidase family protein, partial [Thermoleophilaceae bacterium]|nr:pyridoxamine 5'-phosphate oxidase family protein [Thermoleophilaceae bacterium]